MTRLDPKDPDVDTQYAIDPRPFVYAEMRRNWPYEVGDITRAKPHTGWYYECTAAGETQHHHVTLPRGAGVEVEDGSVIWVTRHPSDVELPEIEDVDWTVTPDGLSVTEWKEYRGVLYPTLSGGRARFEYELTARVNWSTGQSQDLTVIVPVRHL